MKEIRKYGKRTWTAITALCSSILTTTFSNLMTSTTYTVTQTGEKESIVKSIPNSWSVICLNCFKVVFIFFVIWLSLNFLLYIGIAIYKKIYVRPIKQPGEEELRIALDSAEERTIRLNEKWFNIKKSDCKSAYVAILIKEEAQILHLLYDKFHRENDKLQRNQQKMFRTYPNAGIGSLGKSMSKYELRSILSLLESLLKEFQDAYNPKDSTEEENLIEDDFRHLSEYIKEIKTCFDNKGE